MIGTQSPELSPPCRCNREKLTASWSSHSAYAKKVPSCSASSTAVSSQTFLVGPPLILRGPLPQIPAKPTVTAPCQPLVHSILPVLTPVFAKCPLLPAPGTCSAVQPEALSEPCTSWKGGGGPITEHSSQCGRGPVAKCFFPSSLRQTILRHHLWGSQNLPGRH